MHRLLADPFPTDQLHELKDGQAHPFPSWGMLFRWQFSNNVRIHHLLPRHRSPKSGGTPHIWSNLSDNSEDRSSLSEDVALAIFTIHRTGFLKKHIYIYLAKLMFTLLHLPRVYPQEWHF